MDSAAQPLEDLHAFRNSLYECLHRRADALFELTDALLTAGTVPSPVHLSLRLPIAVAGAASTTRSAADESTPKALRELLASPSACRKRTSARLRRGRERVGSLRRGEQPRAGLLLPSFSPLGGAAHRSRLGLPVRRTAQFRARELGRPRGRGARPPCARRQRGGSRAGKALLRPA